MFQGFLFFWKYCWREQKSYALLLMAAEVVGAFLFLAGLIFPKYILDSLFVCQLPRQAIFFIGLFLGITLFSNVMQALLRFYAERSRDQMYRKFSLTYARAILQTDYANLEKPEYMDLKENALRCMSGVYGFAGAVF